MLLYIPNEEHNHIIFFDTEFNSQKLIQVSLIIYERIIVDSIPSYLLSGSINLYIDNEINQFFTQYTGINQTFLNQNAVSQQEAKESLQRFLAPISNSEKTLLVAHGLKQDRILLEDMGLNIDRMDRYCTYTESKKILNRDKDLRLIDICNESGYFTDQHDAYSDAKNVIHAFSYLKLIETTVK